MRKVNEAEAVRTVLERGDTIIKTEDMEPGYQGIVVEATSGQAFFKDRNDFEGTVVYFPGVPFDLLCKK